jgi:hypothetical protein
MCRRQKRAPGAIADLVAVVLRIKSLIPAKMESDPAQQASWFPYP